MSRTANELPLQDPRAVGAVFSHYYKQGDRDRDKSRQILAAMSGKPSVSPQAWLLYGQIGGRLDHTREAIQSYARALELEPGSAKASLGLGVAQRLAGRTRDAGETFERGIRRFPLNASFYQEYGLLSARAGDSGDEAARSRSAALLRKALDLVASLVEPHYQLGQLALSQGNPEEAARHFETAVRLARRENQLRYGLVRAYRRLGRQQQAREQAGKYRQLKAAEDAEGTPTQ